MINYIGIWFILFLISFYDLSENKIPNKLLIILAVVGVPFGMFDVGVKEQILGFVLYFSGGLFLYFIRVMSRGCQALRRNWPHIWCFEYC